MSQQNSEMRNSYGLFDSPHLNNSVELKTLTPEILRQQLDAGAFFMDEADAIAEGFLNPQDNSKLVTVFLE